MPSLAILSGIIIDLNLKKANLLAALETDPDNHILLIDLGRTIVKLSQTHRQMNHLSKNLDED